MVHYQPIANRGLQSPRIDRNENSFSAFTLAASNSDGIEFD